MRRVVLVLVALALGVASSTRAFPAYNPELVERPPWRFLLDGGITIPLDQPIGSYQVGGGPQRLSTRVTTDYASGASSLEVTRGGGPLFVVGGGITARTEARLAFFLETHIVYLFANGGSGQLFSVRLGISMP